MANPFANVGRDFVLNILLGSSLLPRPLRPRFMSALGMNVGRCRVSPRGWYSSTRITIGDDTYVNYEVMFDAPAHITIGARCLIGMGTKLITGTHKMGGADRRGGPAYARAVTIEDGCWLGANVTVLPGVTIGRGSVVAAGAVVSSDLPANGLYGGVPAKLIRKLDT
ncbi:acyltransferase [Microbacterium sp. F1-18]